MASINFLVYNQIKELFKLSRLESDVFFRLNGFLIRNEKPFPYSAESISENANYSKRSIFIALSALEKYLIIEREGLGYNRKFKRGKIFNDILNMCINIATMQELHSCANNTLKKQSYPQTSLANNSTTAQKLHRPVQKLHRPVQKLHTGITYSLNLEKLKDLSANANSTSKTQNQYPEYSEEQEQLIGKYYHGLNWPEFALTGIEEQKALALIKRHANHLKDIKNV